MKLSPSIRVSDRADAIPTVPFESIAPFIRNLRVLSPEEFEGLPYIVANEEARLTATNTDQTFGRGLDAQVGEEFVVARLIGIYDSFGKPPETRRVLPKTGLAASSRRLGPQRKSLYHGQAVGQAAEEPDRLRTDRSQPGARGEGRGNYLPGYHPGSYRGQAGRLYTARYGSGLRKHFLSQRDGRYPART